MQPEPLVPGSTIGILGSGQLGRFLAIAAAKLGFKSAVYAPEADGPAFHVAARRFRADYRDEAALAEFAKSCDAVTFEFENVPAYALEVASRHTIVRPNRRAAEIAQNRILEKRFLKGLELAVAPYATIESEEDLAPAAALLAGWRSGILKRAVEGYDGRGQRQLSSPGELETAFADLGRPCVLEAKVEFAGELSAIVVRSPDGQTAVYDCPENRHAGGILRTSTVPARFSEDLIQHARDSAMRIAHALDYCGVLAVEYFAMAEGAFPSLLVNEIAPRVHNSGHWTMDACVVDQFENHIRAVAGWPLGSPARHSDAVMTNLIGAAAERWRSIAADSAASLYLYGKAEAREGRKLGHVTRISSDKRNKKPGTKNT
jgi:5-(carboxyamino)imidazole ribonucleotide synthase